MIGAKTKLVRCQHCTSAVHMGLTFARHLASLASTLVLLVVNVTAAHKILSSHCLRQPTNVEQRRRASVPAWPQPLLLPLRVYIMQLLLTLLPRVTNQVAQVMVLMVVP